MHERNGNERGTTEPPEVFACWKLSGRENVGGGPSLKFPLKRTGAGGSKGVLLVGSFIPLPARASSRSLRDMMGPVMFGKSKLSKPFG